jgi:high-affinity iron transporter
MIASFIIAFRETLEAALVVGIVLGFLQKTNQKPLFKTVYLGIVAGTLASLVAAFLFNMLVNGFDGVEGMLFEGITMYIGAALLSTMILWMMRRSNVAAELRSKVSNEIQKGREMGLFLVVFVAIIREGIETVLFLSAANFVSDENNLWGSFIGMGCAILLGYLVYAGSIKINLKKFFNITSMLLIFFAAGLVAYGTHELVEAAEENGIVSPLLVTVWNINPLVNLDGTYPLLHDNGAIGSILKGLFGYNGDPAFIEVILYIAFLAAALAAWSLENKLARSRRASPESQAKIENMAKAT